MTRSVARFRRSRHHPLDQPLERRRRSPRSEIVLSSSLTDVEAVDAVADGSRCAHGCRSGIDATVVDRFEIAEQHDEPHGARGEVETAVVDRPPQPSSPTRWSRTDTPAGVDTPMTLAIPAAVGTSARTITRVRNSIADPVDLSTFVHELPKAEWHVHLVGRRRCRPSGPGPPASRRRCPVDERELLALYRFSDFAHFIDVYIAVNSSSAQPPTWRISWSAWRADSQLRTSAMPLTVTPTRIC